MTTFTTYKVDTASESAKPLLEAAKAAFGFEPNLLGNMAESPALLEGYMTLARIFNKTQLSETERQIILMTNNRLNGCAYCMAAHTTIAKGSRVAEDVIQALREGTPIKNEKYEALRTFAVVVNEKRGWPSDEDIEALLSAGYTRETVLEVVF